MANSEKVIDHCENPRNVGTLDKDDPNVGTGLKQAAQQGLAKGHRARATPAHGTPVQASPTRPTPAHGTPAASTDTE
jgi:hypothetical protein